MNHWIRIFFASVVLVGGTAGFGYWATNEFESIFSKLADTSTQTAQVYIKNTNVEDFGTTTIVTNESVSTTTTEVATSSPLSAYFDSKNFYLVTPEQGSVMYTGCSYDVRWNEPNILSSADLWIVNADTIEKIHPSVSLLSMSSTTLPTSKIGWTVGQIPAGVYYILFSKINEQDFVYRSDKFSIEQIIPGMSCPDL